MRINILFLMGTALVVYILTKAGKHEQKKARKKSINTQYRLEAKQKEAYRLADLLQETLRASGKVERKYSETMRRAESFQGVKGSRG